jgi:hypothetical protein
MLHGAEVLPRLHTNCAKLQIVKFNIQAVPNAPDGGGGKKSKNLCFYISLPLKLLAISAI